MLLKAWLIAPTDSTRQQRLFFFYGPILLYAALIFYISTLHTARASLAFYGSDKLLHTLLYMPLGFLTLRALAASFTLERLPMLFWLAVLFGVCYGGSDEFHQYFVPYRDSDIFDVVADSLGSLLGAWTYILSVKFFT